MKQITKEWLSFLREQYPVGSRIRLNSMEDPFAPIEPGTMGTLRVIDDIGTFHVDWDNGRTLGVVPGEDSFSLVHPEPTILVRNLKRLPVSRSKRMKVPSWLLLPNAECRKRPSAALCTGMTMATALTGRSSQSYSLRKSEIISFGG